MLVDIPETSVHTGGESKTTNTTCKAQYMASAIQECMYLQQVLRAIDTYQYAQYAQTKVYNDNQGAIGLARNPVNHQS